MSKQKIWLLMMIFCIIGSVSGQAQARISSVYGVNLGDSESVVTSKISGTWNTYNGNSYYRVNNPQLGNCSFQIGNFYFEHGKLNKVVFASNGGSGAMDTEFKGFQGQQSAYSQFSSNVERYKKAYQTMYSDLSIKYGSPIVDYGDRAIWKSNGNQIELKLEYEDESVGGNFHQCNLWLGVTYSVCNSSSYNY